MWMLPGKIVVILLVWCLSMPASGPARAQETGASEASREFFEKKIRPALEEHCIRCHGAKKMQGGLRLDSREGWQKGGDSGAAIIPGDEESLLLKAISYEDASFEMPPRGKLPEKVREAFRTWIQSGAFDPRRQQATGEMESPEAPTVADGRNFWAFQPIRKPLIPDVSNKSWVNNDLDRFILAKLEERGLDPVADTNRASLLRRLTFDLTGLPPSPKQMELYLPDGSDDATERLIDRLLDSPRYGERWGRHWLDVVRFAESSGGGRTLLFPDAWRYRDYVIQAFNQDLPFDEFVKEQIAGDLLPTKGRIDRQRKIVATGFLMLGPTNYEMQDKDILEMDVVDEQLDTMGKAMLGMTIGCARCHDHKFDPIPTRDYYALAGIFKSTYTLKHSNVSTWNTVELPLPEEEETSINAARQKLKTAEEKLAAANAELKKLTGESSGSTKSVDMSDLDGVIVDSTDAEVVGKWKNSTSVGRYVGSDYIHDDKAGKGEKSVKYSVMLPETGRYEVFASYSAGDNRASKVPYRIRHRGGETVATINQRKKPSRDGLMESLGIFEFDHQEKVSVLLMTTGTDDGVVIADAIIWKPIAGDKEQKVVQSQGPAVDAENEAFKAEIEAAKSEVNRLNNEVKAIRKAIPKRPVAMAPRDVEKPADIHVAVRGMTHQKGDLVPRGVLEIATWKGMPEVNRGASGRLELAQWLASEKNPLTARVIANRVWYWIMGRGIVASVDNFGSTGNRPTHPLLLDYLASFLIENNWSIKALVREIVSSRVYQLSSIATEEALQKDPGNLCYGRRERKRLLAEDIRDAMLMAAGNLDFSVGGPTIKEGTSSEYGYQFEGRRRSVYVPVFRNRLPQIFEVFDFADPNIQGGQRATSNVASQSLLMMNQPFVIEQASDAAKRLENIKLDGNDAMLKQAYAEVLGRRPTEQERLVLMELLAVTDPDRETSQWASVYQLLFQCIDFRYLD